MRLDSSSSRRRRSNSARPPARSFPAIEQLTYKRGTTARWGGLQRVGVGASDAPARLLFSCRQRGRARRHAARAVVRSGDRQCRHDIGVVQASRIALRRDRRAAQTGTDDDGRRVPRRLRFADLTLAGQDHVVSLVDAGRVVSWTPIAKDGRALPARLRQDQRATNAMTIGETRDFRFVPAHPGRLELQVYDRITGTVVASQAIDGGAR